jgi:hypothetical protein
MKTKKQIKEKYPRIKEFGLKIHKDKGIPYINNKELAVVLKKNKIQKLFSEYFGVQSCLLLDNGEHGLYVYDVNSVLERIATGKLISTQLNWD